MIVDVSTPTAPEDAGCRTRTVSAVLSPAHATEMATLARALSDPIRVQLVAVLREHPGDVCQCVLTPLFDVSQPTVSHHLRKLREAGIVEVQWRGVWAYYSIRPGALGRLSSWLAEGSGPTERAR